MSEINPEDISPEDLSPEDLVEAIVWPPIPDEEIVKGHTLTPTRLIELGAMAGEPGSGKWAFRLLALRDELQRKYNVSIRILKCGLHINTDSEASGYHNGRAENAVHTIKRQISSLHRLVDVRNLSSLELSCHDRNLCIWGAKMAALKRAEKAAENAAGKITEKPRSIA
jgi:hypothetical protein